MGTAGAARLKHVDELVRRGEYFSIGQKDERVRHVPESPGTNRMVGHRSFMPGHFQTLHALFRVTSHIVA